MVVCTAPGTEMLSLLKSGVVKVVPVEFAMLLIKLIKRFNRTHHYEAPVIHEQRELEWVTEFTWVNLELVN